MQSLAHLSNNLLGGIDPDLAKAARAARIQTAFAESVLAASESQEAALYLLGHVQAVYVMRDEAPRKNGKTPILLRIYSDDSVVRAELDARQEWIRLQLAQRGIHYDKMVIHASKYGMRKRHPFDRFIENAGAAQDAADNDVARHDLTQDAIDELANRVSDPETAASLRAALEATAKQSTVQGASSSHLVAGDDNPMTEKLETLKRALCLTFGENAESVLDKINAAHVFPLAQQNEGTPLRYQKNRCLIYSCDPRLKSAIDAYDEEIRKNAYRLGLRIYGRINVREAPLAIKEKRAYPPLSAPQVISLSEDA